MKNKEIDMKGASELLGVSYGTLYGRYTLYFGGLKQTVKPVKVDLVVRDNILSLVFRNRS